MQSTITVAVTDDHALVRAGIARLISNFDGFDVIMQAEDGRDLLEKLSTAEELPQVCVIDINMPNMNGYETVTRLRSLYPDIQCIALTMHDSEFSILKMFSLGAKGFILKGNSPQELHSALQIVSAGNYYHPEIVSDRMIAALQANHELMPKISEKEYIFLKYCCTDLSYKEIAGQMKVSVRTIDTYRDDLFSKLKINSRTGLALYAIKSGMVSVV